MNAFGMDSWDHLWQIFVLFAIPIGGGIPAGVLLSQKYGLGWLPMSGLYLVSDIILAFLFEPILMGIAYLGRYIPALALYSENVKAATQMLIKRYGANPGIGMLIAISFGVDPMMGRAAALSAGHNFISGWAIAILGDMFFFGMIAISTILLSGLLGDGTVAALIVMAVMFLLPRLVDRFRK